MSIMSCQEVKCRMREESSRPLETTSSPNSLEEQEKEVALVLDFDNFNYHVLDKRASPVLIMSVRLDSLQSISLFFPSDNQSWEASDDPEEPCRWPWYSQSQSSWGGGGKSNLLNKHYGSSDTNTKLLVSQSPLHRLHLLQARAQFNLHVSLYWLFLPK